MQDLLKNSLFVIILVTVFTIVVIGTVSTFTDSVGQVGNILSVPLSPVQKLFTFTSKNFDAFISFFKDTKAIKQENELLRLKVTQLESENRELHKLREKNEELREAFNLKGLFDNYKIVGANIIAKDPGNWFDIFTVDVGLRDGITSDLAVVTADKGLVGRVLNSHVTSARVLAIIDEDSVVSGWIPKEKGGSVRISGNLFLKDDGLCRMDYIPSEVSVDYGDVVETSGLGGIYPKGIIIGRVIEVRYADDDFKRYAIVKPEVDFKKIEEVFILSIIKESNESDR